MEQVTQRQFRRHSPKPFYLCFFATHLTFQFVGMTKQKDAPIEQRLADLIRASEKSREPVETMLATDERVLARITDGIYR